MDLQLSGKTALVTGASAGIGTGIALALAKEGVRLAITGRNEAALNEVAAQITATGGHMPTVVAGDVATEEGPLRLADTLKNAGGQIVWIGFKKGPQATQHLFDGLMEFRLVRVAFFQAGKEGVDGFDHGKVSANLLSLEDLSRTLTNQSRTGTAQNVAFMKLNGAQDIN